MKGIFFLFLIAVSSAFVVLRALAAQARASFTSFLAPDLGLLTVFPLNIFYEYKIVIFDD